MFQAIASSNSGATAPSTTYANQLWYDTANNQILFRNEDNDAWIKLFQLDQSNDVASTLATIIDILDASGTNTAGTDLTIRAGAGTGSGAGGKIILQTADGGSSGSSVNSHATAVTIADDGNVGIGTTPGAPLHVKVGTNENFRISSDSGVRFQAMNDAASAINTMKIGGDPLIFLGTGGTERMRVDSSGDLFVAKTSQNVDTVGHELRADGVTVLTASGASPLFINRKTNDGALITFMQAGNTEGTISVSGTTVQLNGAHLTRWAQLSDGSKDTSILRGTVMTNLDQMAVWSHDAVAATYYVDGDELPEITPATYYTEDDTLPDGVSVGDEKTAAVYAQVGDEKTPAKDAYTEDNEQLNCVAVSSVEGDPNVAGVLSSWDDDDDQFNDMKIGMTGDMVIRIAQGTTVARGNLLMSAGDGTAKPQGDDVVRSKTIAKITSTNVSHTYDDGSYLVPCVLMAC